MSRALRLTYALSALPLAIALTACNGDDQASASDSATESSSSDSDSSSASASNSATDTDPATASATATATATDGSASATDGSASATDSSASATATDGSASASATDSSSESDTDGSATDSDGTATDSDGTDSGVTVTDSDSDSDSDSDGTDSDTMGCPEGTEGCPCFGDDSCDGDLVCDGGTCVVDAEPVCGNGIVELGEECDDGNDDELDGCTSQCKDAPVCPAGTEDCPCDGDSCDEGLMCEAGTCIKEAVPVCGNGVLEPGESCDDGNNQNWDACDNSCKPTSFGMDPCGYPEDGIWLDINYKNSGSCWSPSWKFSATPGFGEKEWAPNQDPWPEINAAGGPQMNYNDPYGTVCDIGSGNKWVRIMLGLDTLVSYESATVCIEGRSISVGSSVTVELANPDNGYCGAEVQLSNSWWADPVGAELPLNCLKPGDIFQALQIDPVGGSNRLGLRSARITLHKPVY